MTKSAITIITPTTGSDGLERLFESLERQTVKWTHILLWDNKREGKYLYPDAKTLKVASLHDINGENRYSIVIPDDAVQGPACGSALRAIGLMAANTPYVTFADSDVYYEDNHLETMLEAVKDKEWAYCKRRIWESENDCIGIDDFESVGDSLNRKVPYEMVDNNCMIFSRRFGSSGAVLYRETKEYNDDRLFYHFLKDHAGEPGKTELATVNQICPPRLEGMFRQYCTKE